MLFNLGYSQPELSYQKGSHQKKVKKKLILHKIRYISLLNVTVTWALRYGVYIKELFMLILIISVNKSILATYR